VHRILRQPRRVAALSVPAALAAVMLSGCGGSSADEGAVAAASPANTRGTAHPTIRPSGSLPPEAAAKQGAKYYAVFLAVAADANDPPLTDAQERAKALGYPGGAGAVNCTPGARTALNLSDNGGYTAYSIFFETNKQAQDFLNAYSGKVIGTANITAGCLD
jgi:hypothetical protein